MKRKIKHNVNITVNTCNEYLSGNKSFIHSLVNELKLNALLND